MKVRNHDSGSDEGEEGEAEGGVVEEKVPEASEPPKYAVLLLNDDYTTMEFVIEVLQKFFHKNKEQATAIMLKVHQEGRGVAGIYSHDIAETKVAQVSDYARRNGHPLKCICEAVDGGE